MDRRDMAIMPIPGSKMKFNRNENSNKRTSKPQKNACSAKHQKDVCHIKQRRETKTNPGPGAVRKGCTLLWPTAGTTGQTAQEMGMNKQRISRVQMSPSFHQAMECTPSPENLRHNGTGTLHKSANLGLRVVLRGRSLLQKLCLQLGTQLRGDCSFIKLVRRGWQLLCCGSCPCACQCRAQAGDLTLVLLQHGILAIGAPAKRLLGWPVGRVALPWQAGHVMECVVVRWHVLWCGEV